jgi:glucans biosynthesis protein
MTKPATLLACLALASSARAFGFGFEDVVARAQQQAAAPYVAPRETPPFLREVGYDQYRGMRYQIRNNLWADSHSRFQVTPVMPGGVYAHIIPIHIVHGDSLEQLTFHKEYFKFDDEVLAAQLPPDLGYAGFELSYPQSRRDVQEKFSSSPVRAISVASATVGSGVSARRRHRHGLAEPEEFRLRRVLARAAGRDGSRMTLYALLDSPRLCARLRVRHCAGAGPDSRRALRALHARSASTCSASRRSQHVSTARTCHDRPAPGGRKYTHSGRPRHSRRATRLWQPLLAPRGVRLDEFPEATLEAFGLLQRDTQFASYQDPGTRYERRPSALVETQSACAWARRARRAAHRQ